MKLTFANLNSSGLRSLRWAEVLVNVEADFEITEGNQLIYKEPAFPVVELAYQILAWLKWKDIKGDNFEFDSMSFEENGVVRVMRYEDGWRIGSIFDPEVWSEPITAVALDRVVMDFYAALKRKCDRELNIDITRFVEP